MVKMGADQLTGISVGLLFNGIVDQENPIVRLDLTQMGFDDLPEVLIGEFLLRQEARDLIVGEVRNECGKPRGSGGTERDKQIVGVKIKQA